MRLEDFRFYILMYLLLGAILTLMANSRSVSDGNGKIFAGFLIPLYMLVLPLFVLKASISKFFSKEQKGKTEITAWVLLTVAILSVMTLLSLSLVNVAFASDSEQPVVGSVLNIEKPDKGISLYLTNQREEEELKSKIKKEKELKAKKIKEEQMNNVEPQAIGKEFDVFTHSGYTREQLISSLNHTPQNNMIQYVDSILRAEQKYNVNALYLLSKFSYESGWGRYMAGANNIGGWKNNSGIGFRDFDSVDECIDHIAYILSTKYKAKVGHRIDNVCYRYCTDEGYLKNVLGIMQEREDIINDN